MNITNKICILIIILLIFLKPAFGSKNETQVDFKNLQNIAEENHVVGMTVLGYRDDSVRFIYNYGYSNISRKIKMNNDTIFFIASVSKIVTGIAIMKLIEEGKIKNIEQDISKFIGYTLCNPKYAGIPVTIRHLMTHSSGIKDSGISSQFVAASYSQDPPSMKELFSPNGKYFDQDIWLNSPPGTIFNYSNFGAILAGAIVGKISGKRFDIFINEMILRPVGIYSGFTIHNVKDVDKVAVVYMLDNDSNPYVTAENYSGERPAPIDLSDYIPGNNPTMLGPHGGLRIAAASLAKIMEIFLNRGVCRTEKGEVRLLNEQSIDLMLKTHWDSTGFSGIFKKQGLFIHITDDLIPGVRMYGHAGDALGLLSAMYFNPGHNFGIIFLMNGGDHTIGNSGFYRIEEQVFREGHKLLFK